MLLNQSQIYESHHQAHNITENEIEWFIDRMQNKYQSCYGDMKKINNSQYERMYAEWTEKFQGNNVSNLEVYQAMEREREIRQRQELVKNGQSNDITVEKQSISTSQNPKCKYCHHQFNSITSLIPKYTCGICSAIFCQKCLGRFQANTHNHHKKPTEQTQVQHQSQHKEQQQQKQEQKHHQSTPTCIKCDYEHMKLLVRIQNDRMFQLGKQVLNKIKNVNLELDLEINYEKSNPRLMNSFQTASSSANKLNKLGNRQTELIISNGLLQSEVAEIRKKIQYGLVIQKQLNQKYIKLLRTKSRSVTTQFLINPPCPYESQTGQSQTDTLRDKDYKQSILEDETRLVDSRKCPFPCCPTQ